MTDTPEIQPICAKCGDILEPWQVYAEAYGKFYCGECVHIKVLPGAPDTPCACSRMSNVAGSIREQVKLPVVDMIALKYGRAIPTRICKAAKMMQNREKADGTWGWTGQRP